MSFEKRWMMMRIWWKRLVRLGFWMRLMRVSHHRRRSSGWSIRMTIMVLAPILVSVIAVMVVVLSSCHMWMWWILWRISIWTRNPSWWRSILVWHMVSCVTVLVIVVVILMMVLIIAPIVSVSMRRRRRVWDILLLVVSRFLVLLILLCILLLHF
jgi:hypothetical protein